MPAIKHGLEVWACGSSEGTEINMYEHKNRNYKAYKNMQQVGQVKSTQAKYIVDSHFRV